MKSSTENALKRKTMCEELENVKRKKAEFEKTISELRHSFEKETFKADRNQDLSAISKAAAFLKAANDKEKTLKELDDAQINLEKDLKTM